MQWVSNSRVWDWLGFCQLGLGSGPVFVFLKVEFGFYPVGFLVLDGFQNPRKRHILEQYNLKTLMHLYYLFSNHFESILQENFCSKDKEFYQSL